MSASCVNREVVTLKAALSWASDPTRDPARRLDRTPLVGVGMLRQPEPRNPTLTAEDEARSLAACSPPWLRELVEMLLATGLPPGEALALRWSDLNPDQGVLVVRHSKSVRTRLVPVPARVLDMLLARRPGTRADGLVFTSRTGKAISVGKAGHHFRRVAERVGLRGFTPHGLRHGHESRPTTTVPGRGRRRGGVTGRDADPTPPDSRTPWDNPRSLSRVFARASMD